MMSRIQQNSPFPVATGNRLETRAIFVLAQCQLNLQLSTMFDLTLSALDKLFATTAVYAHIRPQAESGFALKKTVKIELLPQSEKI